MNITQNRPLSK